MSTFLASLTEALYLAVRPLESSLRTQDGFEQFLTQFGWDATLAAEDLQTIQQWIAVGTRFEALQPVVEQLLDGPDDLEAAAKKLFEMLVPLIRDIQTLVEKGVPPSPPFPLTDPTFQSEFPLALLDYLLIKYLEREQPLIFGLLLIMGIIEITQVTFEPLVDGRIPYLKHELRLDRLGELASAPGKRFSDQYSWGHPSEPLQHDKLLRTIEHALLALRYPVRYALAREEIIDQYPALTGTHELAIPILAGTLADRSGYLEVGLLCVPISSNGGAVPDGLLLTPISKSFIGTSINLSPAFTLALGGSFESTGAVLAEIFPDRAGVKLNLGSNEVDAAAIIAGQPAQPWLLVGSANSHRIELGGVRLALLVRGSVTDPEVIVEVGTGVEPDPPKLAVVIEFADADGFLQKIIGSQPIRLEASGGLQWSSKRGLSFSGSAGIIHDIPINKTLGFIRVDTLTVGIMASTSGGVDIIAALTGNASLGPIVATAEKVGVKLELVEPKPGEVGLFGSLDLAFGFKPPEGIGIAVDAGPVTGGGFISFDHANGRYAGVLQLQLASIGVTAIGLLDTKLPGGQPGFSFLLIITATFPPIQLGFGFTLNGLGGLAGINRTIVVETLQAGVRNKAVDHVLFPVNPVANATQLISNLRSFFPPAAGRYIFGPIAILGWGTPPMIEAELGIILEIPAPVRLILLGQINAVIPDKKAAIVELHLDILGIIDFGGKQLSIDASLHNSRVGIYDLSGDMALRLNWGGQPNFAFAVGGFNPHFQPPPGFPELRRLTLALGSGKNPRISLQAYLAVTSNSFQVGARADLYAEAAGFNIAGWAGFDALFIFDPFSFQVDLFAGMALRRGKSKLAGISVEAHLTGPTPWHAWGKGCLETFLGDICVAFDATFGPPAPALPRPAVDVWSLLGPAISDPRNWTSELPQASARAVSFALPPGTNAGELFDPLGTATLRQKVAPLNRELTRFGEADIAGEKRFNVSGVSIGGAATQSAIVKDYFAEAQFEELSDAEKLSRPSFDLMDAGVTAGIDRDELSAAGFAQDATYKTLVVDEPERPWLWLDINAINRVNLPLLAGDLIAQVSVGAGGTASLDHSGLAAYVPALGSPQAVALAEESFTIVSTDTLEVLPDLPAGMTKGEAYRVMKAYLVNNPAARGTVQVVPAAELAV